MSKLVVKTTLLSAMLIFFAFYTRAQDVIIKNDKTEIKSKVTELTETMIKYKKWDNIDGPIYNIALNDVFMILYSNGQREIIKQPENNSPIVPETTKTVKDPNNNEEGGFTEKGTQTVKIDKNTPVVYHPYRINLGLQSPFTFGIDGELKIVKNILNIGVTYLFFNYNEDYILYSQFACFYASLYAPTNRLSGKYENQNKGLFLFGHVGYGITATTVSGEYYVPETISSGGFSWRLGMDYYVTPGFGFTLSTYAFKTFYGGIEFSF